MGLLTCSATNHHASTEMLTLYTQPVTLQPRLSARAAPRALPLRMKSVIGHRFSLDMWYGDDDGALEAPGDAYYVSPWAAAHHKIRKQEIEIEQCEQQLKDAIEEEDYSKADGLQERVDRLKSQHPILPREERLEEAVREESYTMAAIFQKDLDQVKVGLGLPKFSLGQVVKHRHRELRGIVMNVDLVCGKGSNWVRPAGLLERSVALGMPPDECDSGAALDKWAKQPFYTLLQDLRHRDNAPAELAFEPRNEFKAKEAPAPLYLPEDALNYHAEDEGIEHPKLELNFEGFDYSQHRGRIYRATPRLRLWQSQMAERELELAAARRKAGTIGTTVDGMKFIF